MNINISIRECPKKKKILCYTVYNAGSEYKVRIQQMKILKILIFSKTFFYRLFMQGKFCGKVYFLVMTLRIANLDIVHSTIGSRHYTSLDHFPADNLHMYQRRGHHNSQLKKKAMINLIAALANSFLVVVFKHWKPFFFMLGQGGLFWEEEFLISF